MTASGGRGAALRDFLQGRTGRPKSVYYDGTRPLASVFDQMGVVAGRPVVILVGGAAASLAPELDDARRKIVDRVIVPLCRDERAIVITGGTDAGIMQEVGRAVKDLAPGVVLIGVAPDRMLLGFGASARDRDAAPPEPHHLLIRTPGNAWGESNRQELWMRR